MGPSTADLLDFVWQRTQEALLDAEARGDELRARFAQRSLTILAEVRDSLEDDASIGQLMATRFLRRLAQAHRDHASYREEWRFDDG